MQIWSQIFGKLPHLVPLVWEIAHALRLLHPGIPHHGILEAAAFEGGRVCVRRGWLIGMVCQGGMSRVPHHGILKAVALKGRWGVGECMCLCGDMCVCANVLVCVCER